MGQDNFPCIECKADVWLDDLTPFNSKTIGSVDCPKCGITYRLTPTGIPNLRYVPLEYLNDIENSHK